MLRSLARLSLRPRSARFLSRTAILRNANRPDGTPVENSEKTEPPNPDTPPPPPPRPESNNGSTFDVEEFKSRLLKISDQAATQLRARTDDWTAITKTTFRRLGAELNTMTGYEEIDILKRKVVEQELRTNACRQASKDAKLRYEEAVAARSNSQREVNDLLQRKSSWSDADVSRFTVLIRQDHMLEQEETRAKIGVDEAEVSLEREFSELMRAILGRYHEEQIWSDKIRSAATYGQIAALALNLIVFILAIILVEPWKRKRLAQTFEKKTEELSAETKDVVEAGIADVKKELEVQVRALTVLAEAALKAEAEREEAKTAAAASSGLFANHALPESPGFWDKAVVSGVAAGALTATILSVIISR